MWIKKNVSKVDAKDFSSVMSFANKMYEKCYSGIDLLSYIEQSHDISEERKYSMLVTLHKVKKDFRNEKLFIAFILNYLLIRSDEPLENVSFM